MKIAGIICEYNPFHNGHLYQLNKTRELGATHIAAVMSGNFVQRGDAAIMPKSARVQAAIENGVDLVIELPAVWSTARAESFAKAGVSILNGLGCIDMLSFGSEIGAIDDLIKAADITADEDVVSKTKQFLNDGVSYALARSKAISEKYGSDFEKIMSEPNNILGIEYIKALNSTASAIKPVTIKRKSAFHDKVNNDSFIKSASEIRDNIINNNGKNIILSLPQPTINLLREYHAIGQCPVNIKEWDKMILSSLRKMKIDDFAKLPDVSEGLEYKIYNSVMQSSSVDELIMRIKSKRYSLARIRRIILSAYLGFDNSFINETPPYIRVLGFNEKGKEILKDAKEKATLPIVMKYSDIKELSEFSQKVFEAECRATDLYSLGFEKPAPCGIEMIQNIIMI